MPFVQKQTVQQVLENVTGFSMDTGFSCRIAQRWLFVHVARRFIADRNYPLRNASLLVD